MTSTSESADASTETPETPEAPEASETPEAAALSKTAARVRLGAVVVVLIAIAVAASQLGLSRDGIESFIESAGPWGPVVYVVVYALLTVAFFPVSIVTVLGGVIFGSVQGTILTVIGATIGAMGSFIIGRRLGRSAVASLAGQRVTAIDEWLTSRGFVAMLYARLLPIFPFNALNYIAGVTGLRLREYVLATFVGIIPGTFVFTSLGGNVDDKTSPQFLGSLAAIAVLLIVGPVLARRVKNDDAATD